MTFLCRPPFHTTKMDFLRRKQTKKLSLLNSSSFVGLESLLFFVALHAFKVRVKEHEESKCTSMVPLPTYLFPSHPDISYKA